MVVVNAPSRDQLSGMAQIGEQVLVEALVAKAPIEALDEAILHGFSGRDVMPFDPAILLPFEDGVRCQFRAVAPWEEAIACKAWSKPPSSKVKILPKEFFETPSPGN